MPKRQKCTSCSNGWCKNHLFELKPMINTLFFRKIQKVRLCPRYSKSIQDFQVSLPQTNFDKKYYTPSFLLQEEKPFYLQNDKKMLKNHEQKIQEMAQGATDSIWIAKHGRKRKYCTVCHADYEDYLQHIKLASHKQKINKNKYTNFIKQSAVQYQKKSKLLRKNQTLQETSDCIDNKQQLHECRKTEKIQKAIVRNCEQKIQQFFPIGTQLYP